MSVFVPAASVHDDAAWFREWERPMEGMSYLIPIDWCTAKQVEEGDPDSHALPVLRAAYQDPSGVIHPIRTVGPSRSTAAPRYYRFASRSRQFRPTTATPWWCRKPTTCTASLSSCVSAA